MEFFRRHGVLIAVTVAVFVLGGLLYILFLKESRVEVCRLLSDGTARLKGAPQLMLPKGFVIAQSRDTLEDAGLVVPSIHGESCDQWRRRVARELVVSFTSI